MIINDLQHIEVANETQVIGGGFGYATDEILDAIPYSEPAPKGATWHPTKPYFTEFDNISVERGSPIKLQ
jgi:hypothetical protein